MGKWSDKINQEIDQKLENTREQDLRFFRIDEFKRNIIRVDEFTSSCPDCKRMQIDIAEVVQSVDEAVKVPGQTRREFDRLISRLSKHMQKQHGFYPPFYFSYIYALYGLLGGAAVGYLLWQIIPEHPFEMMGIGISAGLVISYILGNIKDRKIRTNKKIM